MRAAHRPMPLSPLIAFNPGRRTTLVIEAVGL
jgi:hypothetical protein